MRLKRAAAILLVGLVLVLFLASLQSLNSNFQSAYTQVCTYGEVIQKSDYGPQPANTRDGFQISGIPLGSIIGVINISLTNITAPNNILTPENQYNSSYDVRFHTNYFLAMCFNITNDAYLDEVSIRFSTTETENLTLNLTIMNSNVLAQPSNIINSTEFNVTTPSGKKDITLNHVFLDYESTYNGVFFACIKQITSDTNRKANWNAYPDNINLGSIDYGPAYSGNPGGIWTLVQNLLTNETVDFVLEVEISSGAILPYDHPDPNNISLTINEGLPYVHSNGSGLYRLYNVIPQNGLANFTVSSPWNNMNNGTNPIITFVVEANYTLVHVSGGIFSLLPLVLGLIGSSQGGGFLLYFGGGGAIVAAGGLAGGFAFVRSRRRGYLFSGLRKLSRFMVLNASGINVFDFPLSEDESETDTSLIAASISAMGAIEAEADTRGSKVRVRREWFTTDKRVFFNLGFSQPIGDEAESSIFDGWWIGGVFDEPLIDEERNQFRKLFRALGDETIRLARVDSKVYKSFGYWSGNLKVFREFFPEVLINGLALKGLSLDKVKELRLQGVQKSKMIFKLTEMGASILIQEMLASLRKVKSTVVCLNVNREMWIRDTKNLLDKKQINKLEKEAQDKEALLYSTIQSENISRIQAASVYMMLLLKKLASRNVKLDVALFGVPSEKKVKRARGTPPESAEESKIVLENFNPSEPKQWSLFTQKLFDIVSRGEAPTGAKFEFKSIISDIDSWIKDHKGDETVAKIIFTAGGLDIIEIIKLMKSQNLPHTYTLAIGAPVEEKIRTPAQFIPIPSISEANIKPLKITIKKERKRES